MKNYSTIYIISLLIFSSCANSYHVTSDFLPQTDFKTYESYAVLDDDHGFITNADPINMQRIENAIQNELKGMGYEESKTPQLEVFWYVKVDRHSEPYFYRDQYNRWDNSAHPQVIQYKEGTLVIDLIDCASNKVIWHGKTSDRVYEDMKHIDKKIDAAVKEMMDQYRKDAGLAPSPDK